MLEDQTSTTTWYEGGTQCVNCARMMTPVEALYNGTLCPTCARLAQQRLVANKRVGDL